MFCQLIFILYIRFCLQKFAQNGKQSTTLFSVLKVLDSFLLCSNIKQLAPSIQFSQAVIEIKETGTKEELNKLDDLLDAQRNRTVLFPCK